MTEALGENNGYVYKVAEAEIEVEYWDKVRDWTDWDGESDITAETGKVITIVERNDEYHALKAGSATVTAKAADA